MKAMARQRSHSIAFKRQVAQEFIAGESLYALSKRHDISRQLIRVWVEKYEAGRWRRRGAGYDRCIHASRPWCIFQSPLELNFERLSANHALQRSA
jgi:hypothetical protein